MIDGCRSCGKLYETTMEDAYDPREEYHRCSRCWEKENSPHRALKSPSAAGEKGGEKPDGR